MVNDTVHCNLRNNTLKLRPGVAGQSAESIQLNLTAKKRSGFVVKSASACVLTGLMLALPPLPR